MNQDYTALERAVAEDKSQLMRELDEQKRNAKEQVRSILREFQNDGDVIHRKITSGHDIEQCRTCVPLQSTLAIHRDFCNSEEIIQKVLHAYDAFRKFALKADQIQQQAPQSGATAEIHDALEELQHLEIECNPESGCLPRSEYDHSDLPSPLAYTARFPKCPVAPETHNLSKDHVTTAKVRVSATNPELYSRDLEQVCEIPTIFTDTDGQIQEVHPLLYKHNDLLLTWL